MPKRFLPQSGTLIQFVGIFLLFSSFNTGVTEWKFDPEQATVHFTIPGYHKTGDFGGLSGSFAFDPAFPEQTKIDAKISVATVKTGHHMLDWHLKTKSYFDAEDYPEISFHSTSAIKTDTCYYADGQLTMKGVTKDVRLQFYLGEVKKKTIFYGAMNIFAGDYGVGRKNKNGKDKVGIYIEIPISK